MWRTLLKSLILAIVSRAEDASDLGVFVDEKKVVWCYYAASWAQHRTGNGKCDIEDIDPLLCTHLVYAYVGIDGKGNIIPSDSQLEIGMDAFKNSLTQFNSTKQKNPELKTILAVGGPDGGSAKYSLIANSNSLRTAFANHATEFITTYGFDGLDVDWIFPAKGTTHGAADVNALTNLLAELRKTLNRKRPGLILSAAVAALKILASTSYNIPEISKHLDFIGLHSYDMSNPSHSRTGHNAPLHRGEGDQNVVREDAFTVDVAVEYWLAKGAPPFKILLGLPFYGHSYILANATNNGVRAPNKGFGITGLHTKQKGLLGFNEICLQNKIEPWNIRIDSKAKVPYKTLGVDWISYDDKLSLNIKARYSLDKNLAGVMAWTMDTDDCQGACGDGKFPLLKEINKALNYYSYDFTLIRKTSSIEK